MAGYLDAFLGSFALFRTQGVSLLFRLVQHSCATWHGSPRDHFHPSLFTDFASFPRCVVFRLICIGGQLRRTSRLWSSTWCGTVIDWLPADKPGPASSRQLTSFRGASPTHSNAHRRRRPLYAVATPATRPYPGDFLSPFGCVGETPAGSDRDVQCQ